MSNVDKSGTVGSGRSHRYQFEVVRLSDGQGFGRRDVPDSVLEGPREQVLFAGQRSGLLGADLGDAVVVDAPVFRDSNSGQINGLTLSVGDGERRVHRTFDLTLFESLASTVTADLLKSKLLVADDQIAVRIFARPADAGSLSVGAKVRVSREPLQWMDGRLADWIAASEPHGPINEEDYPVFFLDRTLEQAHQLCWKYGALEGGCWLLGTLYRQQVPKPEIYAVIHAAIEARDVTHSQFGLELTSETYHHFQSHMELRRSRLGLTGEVAIAFQHTHPFLPSDLEGGEGCSKCDKRHDCQLSSSFLSAHDARFHNAVFGRAPYAVQIVVGLTPREEFDLRVFCFDGGRFRQRGYYSVAEPPAQCLG